MTGSKRTKAIIGAGVAGAALLAAAACAGTPTDAAKAAPAPAVGGAVAGLASPTMPPEPSPGEMSPGEPSPGVGGMEDITRAGTAAMDAVEGGTVVSLEAEENGKIWEVELAEKNGTEQELEVDSSGKVVSGPTAREGDAEDKAKLLALVKGAELTYQDAAEKVAAAVPEGKITELKLDRHKGAVVWESDVVGSDGTRHQIRVDAKDGTVTKSGQTS